MLSTLEMAAQLRRGMVNKNPLSNKIIICDEFHKLFDKETKNYLRTSNDRWENT